MAFSILDMSIRGSCAMTCNEHNLTVLSACHAIRSGCDILAAMEHDHVPLPAHFRSPCNFGSAFYQPQTILSKPNSYDCQGCLSLIPVNRRPSRHLKHLRSRQKRPRVRQSKPSIPPPELFPRGMLQDQGFVRACEE